MTGISLSKPKLTLFASLLGASTLSPVAMAQNVSPQSSSTPAPRMYNGAVVTGYVVGDPSNGEMIVRARNGVYYRVRPHSGVNLNEIRGGDRVRVFGNLRQQMLDGAGVRVLQRRASPYAGDYALRHTTLIGNVTRGLQNSDFLLRSTGYTYRVRTPGGRFFDVREGDRVRAYGYWTGQGIWQAMNLRVLRRASHTDNDRSAAQAGLPIADADSVTAPQPVLAVPAAARRVGDAVELSGRVTINPEGMEFFIRDANGITHRVRALQGKPENLQTGLRVRTYGSWKNDMMYASNVRVLNR